MSQEVPPIPPHGHSSAMSVPDAMAGLGASESEPEVIRGMLAILFERNPDGVIYADAQGKASWRYR